MPVFLHQLLHTLLRILLIAVGHVAQTEPHRSARDVHHGLCMHATTRQGTGKHWWWASIRILLTSHERVSSDCVAVDCSKDPA